MRTDINRRFITVHPATIQTSVKDDHDEEIPHACFPDVIWNGFFWFLSFFGAFNPISTSKTLEKSYRQACKVLMVIGRITIFCSFLNFIRHLSTFIDFVDFEHTIPKALLSFFYLQCAVNTFILYKISNNKHNMQAFWEIWKKCTQTTEKEMKSLERVSYLIIAISCCVIVGNVTFFGYVSYRVRYFDNAIAPYTSTDEYADILKAIYLLIKVFLSGYWISLCMLEVFITRVLTQELNILLNHLSNSDPQHIKMEEMRQQFTTICDLIDRANDMFQYYNGTTMFTSIGHMLLLLYSLIWFPDTRAHCLVFLAHIFWIIAVTVMLLSVTVSCSIVNSLAHRPMKILYQVPLRNVTSDFSIQYSTFLTQLSAPHIGLSALNLIVIDKSTFLSVSGMLVTYFVVLLQFKQSLEPMTTSNVTICSTV